LTQCAGGFVLFSEGEPVPETNSGLGSLPELKSGCMAVRF